MWWGYTTGEGPCQRSGEEDVAPPGGKVKVPSPVRRDQETHHVSPARAGRCPVDPQVWATQRPAPAGGGAGAGRGLWPPAGPHASAALWQGRWPLPLKR